MVRRWNLSNPEFRRCVRWGCYQLRDVPWCSREKDRVQLDGGPEVVLSSAQTSVLNVVPSLHDVFSPRHPPKTVPYIPFATVPICFLVSSHFLFSVISYLFSLLFCLLLVFKMWSGETEICSIGMTMQPSSSISSG